MMTGRPSLGSAQTGQPSHTRGERAGNLEQCNEDRVYQWKSANLRTATLYKISLVRSEGEEGRGAAPHLVSLQVGPVRPVEAGPGREMAAALYWAGSPQCQCEGSHHRATTAPPPLPVNQNKTPCQWLLCTNSALSWGLLRFPGGFLQINLFFISAVRFRRIILIQ